MLSLNQRLSIGLLFLLALLLGLGLYLRGSIFRMATQSASPSSSRASEAYLAEQDRLEHRSDAVIILTLAAGGLGAILTLYSVAYPLRKTAQSARRMGQGDLQHRVEWRSRDDLGIIATELNRMSVRLRELRETEAGRRQMEYQLSSAVLQSIFEPVIVTDSKGHVLRVNQAAAEILGEAATDRMALANTPGGEKILNAIREAISLQRPIANEGDAALLPMRIGNLDRSYRLRTTPMRDAEGKLLGAVTTLEDVTQLQDIDRFKTRFLAVASRKLRDPLQKLRLALYSLSRGFGGDLSLLQRELITGAELESEQLNDLMADLIEVSELDTGNRQLKLERIRPYEALQEAYDRHLDEAKQKKIEMHIRAFADLSPIMADRRALRSIFDNLLSNALRYTPAEGMLQLEADEVKDKIQFAVRDTGPGIAAEKLPGIFGRFISGHDHGTGLGLALVRRLVESLGGQISVESRLGHGATFRFAFPVAITTETRHPVEIG
jgi:signal transduction histidine kinase